MTNPQTFDNLATWRQSFLAKGMVIAPESFPFIVVGNKLDMEKENRQVSQIQLQRFCQENGGLQWAETSAKGNLGVEEAFTKLAERALARQEEMTRKMEEQSVSQRAIEREKNKRLGKLENAHSQPKSRRSNNCSC